MKSGLLVAFVLVLISLSGCTEDPKSGTGFTLPIGDPGAGRQTFARLQCTACHTVDRVEFQANPQADVEVIALGGPTPKVITYGQLVTSIINPSHRFAVGYADEAVQTDGQSRMRIYNDEMTVTELTNLVAFLQQHYKVEAYQPTPYMPYY